MKELFRGYYMPSKSQFEKMWQTGLIVLDTNVLLEIYRLPKQAREELLAVLKSLKERLWIPYQVAMEFQRNRINVLAAEQSKIDEAVSTTQKNFSSIQAAIAELKLDRRDLQIDLTAISSTLEQAKENISSALTQVQQKQPDLSLTDEIRDEFDVLFKGRVGPPPLSQEDVSVLCTGGEARFERKISPGYMDADKGKNPDEGKFAHQGLIYERRFGDLMLWRQLLAFLCSKPQPNVMLITGDQKDDWWWREKGRTFGPKQDLVDEIKVVANVDTFWMYTPELFLKSARDYTTVKVSQSSLDQLKEIEQDVLLRNLPRPRHLDDQNATSTRRSDPVLLAAVRYWLKESESVTTRVFSKDSPTLVGATSSGLVGYQIFDAREKNPSSLDVQLLVATMKLSSAKRDLDLHEVHIICCGNNSDTKLYGRIGKLIDEGEIASFVMGELIEDRFKELVRFTPS